MTTTTRPRPPDPSDGRASGRAAPETEGPGPEPSRSTGIPTAVGAAGREAVRSIGRRVDPRVQARRARVAREGDLRRLWAVGLVAVLGSTAVGAIAVANSSWLDVERVQVRGADRADPGEVVAATGIEDGQPLIDVDPDGARRAVEAVPWIGRAVVDRDWRGSVTIDVQERTAALALPTAEGYVLVDPTGRQLQEVAAVPDDVMPVTGVELRPDPGHPVPVNAQMAVNLVRELPPDLAASATAVSMADGVLALQLEGGGTIDFGDDRLLADKLVAARTVLARVDLTCLETMLVGVPSKPTIARVAHPVAVEDGAGGGPARPEQEPGVAGGGC